MLVEVYSCKCSLKLQDFFSSFTLCSVAAIVAIDCSSYVPTFGLIFQYSYLPALDDIDPENGTNTTEPHEKLPFPYPMSDKVTQLTELVPNTTVFNLKATAFGVSADGKFVFLAHDYVKVSM